MGKRSDFITLKWGLKAYYNCLLCQRGNPNSLNGSTSVHIWNFDKVLFIFFLFVANEISVIKKLNWQHSLERTAKQGPLNISSYFKWSFNPAATDVGSKII